MMKATLISYTHPTPELQAQGVTSIQELIAFCARVSNPTNQLNSETNEKLIRYMIKHSHWSPFEMANACIEIETTRDIGRQILRHRSAAWQEFSQRYADPTKMDFIIREARLQDKSNRQNSIESEDECVNMDWEILQRHVIDRAQMAYRWAIKNGIAKEQARVVLPEGNTPSRMYMNASIRTWIHYLEVRSAASTQKEHREVALACADVLRPIFPMIDEFISSDKQPKG